MIDKIIAALTDGCADCAVTRRRQKGKVHCPLHADDTPSLDVQEGDSGKPLLFCHSCRDNEGIVKELKERGLWTVNSGVPFQTQETRRESMRYEYETRDGKPAFTVIRYFPKGFSQRGPNGAPNMDGVERVLYHLPSVIRAVESGETVFVVEGERDADSLTAIGLCATTSPQGAGKWSDAFAIDLVNADVVVIADADDPGRKHAREVATSCGLTARSIKVVELPQKDSTDWLEAGGTKQQLLAIVERTPAWDNDGRRILTGKDLVFMYEDAVARRMVGDPDYIGVPTGIDDLDEFVTGYRPGDLWLVVAATGVGKSAMLSTMQMNLDERKIPSLFVSLEMPWIVLVERMILAGVTLDQLAQRAGLLVDEPSLTIDKLETLAKVAKMRGSRVLFLDYAQRMVSEQDSEYERVSAISNALARIARETRLCVVAAAQVSRQGAHRDGRPPLLAEIRASGHLEQDAAVVLSLGRKVGDSLTNVAIQKNRHGKAGQVALEFDPQHGRFVTEFTKTIRTRGEARRDRADAQEEIPY